MERTIYGWMHEDERMALRRWAFGCKVLELGCYEGLSTMQLAMTATHVTTIDTFDGRATPRVQSTEENFHLNMRACGNTDKVFAIKGETSHVMPKLEEKSFDFIFIDADHSYEAVKADIANARRLLKDGGAMALHDCNDKHGGIWQAVSEMEGMHLVEQTNSIGVFREGPKPVPKPFKVAIMYPTYNGWYMHAGVLPSKRYNQTIIKNGTSIITTTFNRLLCEILNSTEEFTHVAMLHADIVPDMYWLDTLIEELEINKLDMVSAVVPLKDQDVKRGITSTGLATDSDWAVRRLTLREIYQEWTLPETFQAADIPDRVTDQGLLLNSGCWAMRWDRPWKTGLYFRQQDRIAWSIAEKKFGAESASEDWDWSRQLLSRGCRLGATTKVKLIHEKPEYHNRGPWGAWERDEDFFREESLIAKTKAQELVTA